MTTPIQGSQHIQAQNTPSISPPTPSGIGSSPSSLSSASSSLSDCFCCAWPKKIIYGCLDFCRKSCIWFLEKIVLILGTIVGWLGGSAKTANATSVSVPGATPPPPSGANVVAALALSNDEQQKICTLIQTLGGSWWNLIRNKAEVQRIGREIDHVHPLKFLACIFGHPTLPKDMDAIKASALTWNPFIKGVTEKMQRDATTLAAHQLAFAQSLNVNPADIQPYFNSCDWEGLVKFLIDVKLNRRISAFPIAPITPTPPMQRPTIPFFPTTPFPFPPPQTFPTFPTNPAPLPPSTPTFPTFPANPAPPLTSTPTFPTFPANPAPPLPSTPTPTPPTQPPAPLPHQLAHLPFDVRDNEILANLLTQYSRTSAVLLVFSSERRATQWEQLRGKHPLRLLAHIWTTPEHMRLLREISERRGGLTMLRMPLNRLLSQTPTNEVLPYVEEFATICRLDPVQTRAIVSKEDWNQLLHNLLESDLTREA